MAISTATAPLRPRKFCDPSFTADGAPRAAVRLTALHTLWFNTGTLCNIACAGCYIDSSPRNDWLVYLSRDEVRGFLAEADASHPELREIGFTGGEPFMNPDFPGMLEDSLQTGRRVLVLSNAMRPLQRRLAEVEGLARRFRGRLAVRVSLDHYTAAGHEAVRGPRTWTPAMDGIHRLAGSGVALAIASRRVGAEDEAALRRGFGGLFRRLGLPLDADDPEQLVLFPEMDAAADVPEITEACWDLLGKTPDDVMCATSRMVVKRKGAAAPAVVACTLTPGDPQFELGPSLAAAAGSVPLNHPHCARFCVLGGAACSR